MTYTTEMSGRTGADLRIWGLDLENISIRIFDKKKSLATRRAKCIPNLLLLRFGKVGCQSPKTIDVVQTLVNVVAIPLPDTLEDSCIHCLQAILCCFDVRHDKAKMAKGVGKGGRWNWAIGRVSVVDKLNKAADTVLLEGEFLA